MKYPKDRFDDFPPALNRRGAHRAPRTRASKFMSWFVALGVFVLLVAVGVGVMMLIDRQVQFTADMGIGKEAPTASTAPEQTPEPTVEPTPEATIDPTAKVSVLNGVGASGLATSGSKKLTLAGWKVNNVADAASKNHATSIIAIANEDQRGAALGIQKALGFGEIKISPNTVAAKEIIITLGKDAQAALR